MLVDPHDPAVSRLHKSINDGKAAIYVTMLILFFVFAIPGYRLARYATTYTARIKRQKQASR